MLYKTRLEKIFCCTGLAICLFACSEKGSRKITMETLLEEMTSFESVSRWPSPQYICLQTSSHDRRSVSPGEPGWFANDDGFGFIRTDTIDGRIEKVLFEESAPGAITRIWLTTQNPEGTMRFYFDGCDTAAWTIPAYDLMQFGHSESENGLILPHTSYEKGVKGGSTSFLPIPYASACRVTLEEPADMNNVPHYYQFNFRRYADDADVETFSAENLRKYSKALSRAKHLLLNPDEAVAKDKSTSVEKNMQPGDTLTLSLPEGTRRVTRVEFRVDCDSADYEQTMRSLVYSACFDGAQTVFAPLSDFSGGGMGAPAVESWYLSADGKGRVVSRWPMPYRENAVICICNLSDSECHVSLETQTTDYDWDNSSMYFHTSWKHESDLPFNKWDNGQYDWNFTTLNGRGVYRGDVLSLFNHSRLWYGEGDEKIYIDGEQFPSHFGTGVEDYYNSSWAPVYVFHTPFGGAPRADMHTSQGYNTFFRTRNLDAIPFARSLKFDMEMMGWLEGSADYATTVFWYGDADATAVMTSGSDEAVRPLRPRPADPARYKIADATEFENLPIASKSDRLDISTQNMLDFPDGLWSGAAHALGKNGQPGDYVEYRLTGIAPGTYSAAIYLTKASDYGRLRLTANGISGPVFDGYDSTVVPAEAVTINNIRITDGHLTIRAEITGRNPKSTGYLFGLDCIVLSPTH